jgi:hypothetical protein
VWLTGLHAFEQPKQRVIELENYFTVAESTFISDGKRISTNTGRIVAWYGIEEGPYNGTPLEIAKKFLQSYAETLSLDPTLNDLKYLMTKRGLGTYHVHFSQSGC